MPIFCEMILHVLSIWFFHKRLLSTIMPRNLMNETTSKADSSKNNIHGQCVYRITKYWVFWRLRDSLLALVHWLTFSSSEFTTLTKVFGFLWE